MLTELEGKLLIGADLFEFGALTKVHFEGRLGIFEKIWREQKNVLDWIRLRKSL